VSIVTRTCAAFAVGLLSAANTEAHDFWLQPQQYWLTAPAVTPFTLQVGHGPARQRSPIRSSRITRFDAVAPDGARVDLSGGLAIGGASQDGTVQLRDPGSYVLVFETDNRAESHLPAIRFNDYLKTEGLTAVLAQRERTHRMDADGSESYSRHAKSIVQVGSYVPGFASQITKPIGLPLEIVPEVSPHMQPRPATLPVRVLFAGRPLTGALVKLTQLEHDEQPLETHLTDVSGQATFSMPHSGTWLLNVIWSTPLPDSRETDFETVFSSLTFALP